MKAARFCFWSLVGALLLGLYLPLIKLDPLLSRDDLDLITPLRSLHGVAEYFNALQSGLIFDLNPLRDLTFAFNLAFSAVPLLGNFHAFNLLLWIFCATVFFRLLRRLEISELLTAAFTLLLICHPVFVNSVGWVSARKHLLAFLFILLATYSAMGVTKDRASRALTHLFYFCAILSQPIVALWPIWWALYLKVSEKRRAREIFKHVAPAGILMLICLGANAWYYEKVFGLAARGFSKFQGSAIQPAFTLAALGRYVFQLCLPLRVSPVEYDPSRALNYLGLPLLAVLFLVGARGLGWRRTLLWLSPFFLALALVTIRPTAVFVSDTYLLWPGMGVFVLIALALEVRGKEREVSIAIGVLSLSIYSVFSLPIARAWLSNETLYAYAYRIEPTSAVNYSHILNLLLEGRPDEALETASLYLDDLASGRTAFAIVVSEHPRISPEKKEELLRKYFSPTLSYSYRLASFLATQGKFGEAYSLLREFAPGLGSFDPHAFSGFNDHGVIAAELVFFCERANSGDNCITLEEHLKMQLKGQDLLAFQRRRSALRLLKFPK